MSAVPSSLDVLQHGGRSRTGRQRVVGLFGVLGILALALSTYTSVRTTDAAVRGEAEARVTTTVTVSALFAEQQMRTLQDIVLARARQDDVVATLIRRESGTLTLPKLGIAELHTARDGITGSLLVDHTGASLEGTPVAYSTRRVASSEWFQSVMATGQPTISGSSVSWSYASDTVQAPRVVVVAAPAFAYGQVGGAPIGVLAVAYSLAAIEDVVSSVAKAQGIRLSVTDQHGVLLAADGVVASELHDLTADSRVAAAIRGDSGTLELDTPTGPALSAYGPVPSIGWTITAELPSAAALAGARRPRQTVVGVALALGALLALGLTMQLRAARRVAALHDQLRELNVELADTARTDPLTSLGNRLRLQEDLEQIAARVDRYGHGYAISLVDIDHFKAYNDTFGHLAGDEVLRLVAQTMRATGRDGDAFYRYGGEEFLCVFPEQRMAGALGAVERIRLAVEELAIPAAGGGHLTLSAGVAVFEPTQGATAEGLLAAADAALYRAKASGRNRVECAPSPRGARLMTP